MVCAPYGFVVEFHGNGAFRKRFTVPASATRGLSAVPDFESVCVGFAQEEPEEPEQKMCWVHRQPIERCPIQCRGR